MWVERDERPHAECLTDLALDEWLAEDCTPAEKASGEAHLAGCDSCRGRRDERSRFNRSYLERSDGLDRLRARLAAGAPSAAGDGATRSLGFAVHRRAWVYVSSAVAAAAGILLMLKVSGQDPLERTRLKGETHLGFYVKSGGSVRQGAPGERVRAGDALRFVVPRGESRYVAVLGRDSRNVTSVYFPRGPRAVRVAEQAGELLGSGVALDSSVTLDDAPGVEHFYGVFCDHAVPTATLGEELGREGRLSARAGCSIAETSIVKQGAP